MGRNTSQKDGPPSATSVADSLMDVALPTDTSPTASTTKAPAAPRPMPTPRNKTANLADDNTATSSSFVSVAGSEPLNTETNRYIFNTIVGITLVFMAFFHGIAIDPSYIPSDATFLGALAAPNSWELPTFISFMQCIALGSFVNVNAPHAIFVAFTDSFSWLAFQIHKRAPTPAAVMPSSLVLSHGRQLLDNATNHGADVYDAFGIQQFALRSHVREKDLFLRALTFFLVGLAVLMAVAIACTLVGRALQRRSTGLAAGGPLSWVARSNHVNFTNSLTSSQPSHVTAKHVTRHILGLTVLFGVLSVLPLSMVSVYEVMQDISSTSGFGSLTGFIAVGVVVAVASVAVGPAFILSSMSEVDLTKYNAKATFGVLYVNLHYDRRLFGAVSTTVQLVSGAIVAFSASSQPVWLAAIHVVYMALVLAIRPFVSALQLVVTVLFELCLVAVYVMMSFMAATDVHTKRSLAYAVVSVVCCLVLFCFVRCLVKLWVFVDGWSPNDDELVGTGGGRGDTNTSQLIVHAGDFGPNKGAGRHRRLPASSSTRTIHLVQVNPNAIV
ncbi:hypothetical protein DYB32_005344 [Aphanomyces invadans]|uniref:TRP C-terminal domain-containing protein n=1 Tax=Aphanomyces invadans TaxID=157072 RepID=A0A3R6VA94_9STRA|nr:hypothetical protein DYB32_005344 [Aphanomyces invadans]